jgi:DNA-binding PadR family transcriptional regulator
MFFGKRFSGYHGSSLSGLEILVLSLIKNNPKITGYDLMQKINKRFKPMWKASAGTIYPLLDRLLEKSMVNAEEIIDENNRKKKIYTVTEKGIEGLNKALKGYFKPSINTLGKFIRTILEGVNFDEKLDDIFSGFPFRDFAYESKINENDLSRENIERIKRTISNMKRRKRRLKTYSEKMNEKIDKYKALLEKLEERREKEAKPIPIVDDDEEFENF